MLKIILFHLLFPFSFSQGEVRISMSGTDLVFRVGGTVPSLLDISMCFRGVRGVFVRILYVCLANSRVGGLSIMVACNNRNKVRIFEQPDRSL